MLVLVVEITSKVHLGKSYSTKLYIILYQHTSRAIIMDQLYCTFGFGVTSEKQTLAFEEKRGHKQTITYLFLECPSNAKEISSLKAFEIEFCTFSIWNNSMSQCAGCLLLSAILSIPWTLNLSSSALSQCSFFEVHGSYSLNVSSIQQQNYSI